MEFGNQFHLNNTLGNLDICEYFENWKFKMISFEIFQNIQILKCSRQTILQKATSKQTKMCLYVLLSLSEILNIHVLKQNIFGSQG